MTDVRFIDASTDSDLERYAAVGAESFVEPEAVVSQGVRASKGRALIRAGLAGDEVVAGYALSPVGQFFGGDSVPAQAVVSVFVHPAWRRRGVAGLLLRDLVDVCRGLRCGLAPLYASTSRLYQRFGWEVCDRTLWCRVRAETLARLRGEGRAQATPPRSEVEAMRREVLRAFDGPLDRPDWWLEVQWDAELTPEQRREYGWYEDGRLTGHVTFRQTEEHNATVLRVQEMVAATPDALRGLYGLLGGYESLLSRITLKNADVHIGELNHLVPDVDKHVTVEGSLCWMQRIIDLDLAARSRGWAEHADARLDLEVSDPCDTEPRRVVLEVSGGHGRAVPGGSARVRCGVGALSAWFSSRLHAHEAQRLSLLDGRANDVALMDSLIPRRPLRAPDHF